MAVPTSFCAKQSSRREKFLRQLQNVPTSFHPLVHYSKDYKHQKISDSPSFEITDFHSSNKSHEYIDRWKT